MQSLTASHWLLYIFSNASSKVIRFTSHLVCQSVCRLVGHHFGPDLNIAITTVWIAMTF